MKLVKIAGLSLVAALLLAPAASAHVVVSPDEALSGSYETFTVSVPNEEDEAAVAKLRLAMPEGVESVTPTVAPGWDVNVQTNQQGEASSITWQGGTIPAGFRDDFTFSAKLPAETGELQWKAYQTYAGGKTVAWAYAEDAEPEAGGEFAETGPFSVTNVVAEAAATTGAASDSNGEVESTNSGNWLGIFIAAAALLVSLAAFAVASKKPAGKKK